MRLISHRGNTLGRNIFEENTIPYINKAISEGFEVEIDLWYVNEKYYLGHDSAENEISISELQKDKVLVHCKNVECLMQLKEEFNCFFHESEKIVLSSSGDVILHVDYGTLESAIAIVPERNCAKKEDLLKCSGVCSDYIEGYRRVLLGE